MENPPIGFRFYPTEEELVGFYLHNQLEGQGSNDITRVIPVIDISGIEPWNLPSLAGELCRGDTEQWFFFAPRQEREARGGRPNRTTASGYWKATGSPGYVYSSDNKVIGMKKTMVFYNGKAPSGRKTKWKMHEYRAIEISDQPSRATPKLRNEFSLCRVYVISGSFQAFDRRPLEGSREDLRIDGGDRGGGGGSSAQQQQVAQSVVDGATSSETSRSGGGDHTAAYLPHEAAGSSSGTNWNANDGVQESFWDWEQLNWF